MDEKRIRVWIGHCDGKPHVVKCDLDGRNIAAYKSKAEAKRHYQDVRKAWLVVETTSERVGGE